MKPFTILLCLLSFLLFPQFVHAEEAKDQKISYSGVGIVVEVAGERGQNQSPLQISNTHPLLVKEILPNSPALKAGLKVHDRILQVDGANVDGLTVEQAAAKMRGKADTKVTIIFQRTPDNKAQSICLKRLFIP